MNAIHKLLALVTELTSAHHSQGEGVYNSPMKLIYLPANEAWSFFFYDVLVELVRGQRFYAKREDAELAANVLGLKVSKRGVVSK